MMDCDEAEERFTPPLRNANDALTLHRASRTGERNTPTPDPCDPQHHQHTSKYDDMYGQGVSIWSPVRRFLSRGLNATADAQADRPIHPIVNPSTTTVPCCSSCDRNQHTINDDVDPCTGNDDNEEDDGQSTCSNADEIIDLGDDDDEDESPNDDSCCTTEVDMCSTSEDNAPVMSQLSGHVQTKLDSCQRNTCQSTPRRRPRKQYQRSQRGRRKKRHDICDLQKKTAGMGRKGRVQRRARRRCTPQPRKVIRNRKQKRKPPWETDFYVDSDVWDFLKQFRKSNASRSLEDTLNRSLGEYAATSIVRSVVGMSDDGDSEQSDSSEASFQDAASIARSMSGIHLADTCPSISSGPPTVIRPVPIVSRSCNESCKDPLSVCALSMTSRQPVDFPEPRSNEPRPRNLNFVRENTSAPGCSNGRASLCATLARVPVNSGCSGSGVGPRVEQQEQQPEPQQTKPPPCRNKDDVSAKVLKGGTFDK